MSGRRDAGFFRRGRNNTALSRCRFPFDSRASRRVPSWRRRTSSRPRTGGGRRWRRRWPAWFSSDGEVSSGSCAVMAGARALAVFSPTIALSALARFTKARLPFVDADSVSFAHVSSDGQLAWRRKSPKTWAPNGTGESQGLMTPDSRGRFVTIRASFRGF